MKRKSATLGLRVETCLCYTVVYMGVCVCMFRKFLRCKFFIRLCAPHRHTSHFCLYKHQSCGYVNHHRIGYKQKAHNRKSKHNWQKTHTQHIITNTPHILFTMRIFRFTALEKRERKIIYTDSRCELDGKKHMYMENFSINFNYDLNNK